MFVANVDVDEAILIYNKYSDITCSLKILQAAINNNKSFIDEDDMESSIQVIINAMKENQKSFDKLIDQLDMVDIIEENRPKYKRKKQQN